MAAVENVEWLNLNSLRSYPIHEDSDTVPSTTSGAKAVGVSIPTCLVVDFAFTLAQDDVKEDIRLGITRIEHAANAFSIEISAHSASASAVVSAISVAVDGHSANTSYKLEGRGDFEDCTGWITLGDLARADYEMPDGTFVFAPGQCDFEVSTMRMAPRGVRSISVLGSHGAVESKRLYGRVRLVGGADVTVKANAPTNSVWIKAQSGAGYAESVPCSCGSGVDGNVIETINGMSVKHVQIVGDQCIHVEGNLTSNRVQITNECGTPCCGCAELQFVDGAISTLEQSVSNITSYAESLQARMAELIGKKAASAAALNAYPRRR